MSNISTSLKFFLTLRDQEKDPIIVNNQLDLNILLTTTEGIQLPLIFSSDGIDIPSNVETIKVEFIRNKNVSSLLNDYKLLQTLTDTFIVKKSKHISIDILDYSLIEIYKSVE